MHWRKKIPSFEDFLAWLTKVVGANAVKIPILKVASNGTLNDARWLEDKNIGGES